MLKKTEFTQKIKTFQNNYESSLGKNREEILFNALNYMAPSELDYALKKTVMKFNKDKLPNIENIIKIAYKTCPQAKKPEVDY